MSSASGGVAKRIHAGRPQDVDEGELDRVFARTWHLVGHTSQVASPGQLITATDRTRLDDHRRRGLRHHGLGTARPDRPRLPTGTLVMHPSGIADIHSENTIPHLHRLLLDALSDR